LAGLIGNLGPWELVLIIVILLIIVGPGKLTSVGKAIGKSLAEFRGAKHGDSDDPEPKKDSE
jgi:sec-independent protein translocase protein TatA